jgi:antitoxin component YwqK of YwqJK toxin-antitoxin module
MKKFWLFLLFLAFKNLTAQEIVVKKTQPIQVNEKDAAYMHCEVLSKPLKIVSDTSLTYYWLSSNEVHHTKGGYAGKLLHGDFTRFYASNSLREKGKFVYGVKDGEWKSWHENGLLKEISHWKKGLKDGWYEYHNDKGQLVSRIEYRNNRFDGTYREYEDNQLVRERKFKNNKEIVKAPRKKKEPKPAEASGEKKDSWLKTSWLKIKNGTKSLFKKKEKPGADKNIDNKAREKTFKRKKQQPQ